MKVVAVMPAWNEAPRIRGAVSAVLAHVDAVLVVDDGSSDQTAYEAEQAGARVVRHALNRGQGAALKTGTVAALRLGADIVVHIDADGQHAADDIDALVAPIRAEQAPPPAEQADVVFGSRFLASTSTIPFMRRLLLLGARWFNTLVVGIPSRVTDPQSGMRALSRAAAERIDFHQDRMAHCSEILRLVTHSDLKWMEVPIHVRYTTDTLAKGQKSSDAFKIVWQLFMGAWRR